jgi:outer membrane protein OmpA-like peptidoglycan-associated protein
MRKLVSRLASRMPRESRFERMRLPRLSLLPLLFLIGACSTAPPAPSPATAPEPPAREADAAVPVAPPAEPAQNESPGAAIPARRPDAQVRFMPDSDRIDPASQQALAEVAQRWARNKSQWIVLRARPAPGGSREYAQARAMQDCYAVEARLGEMGVPERRVRAQTHGRRVPEAGERRVDVYLELSRPE